MNERYPFVKCFHPKQIVNPYTKETLIVPCGVCEACVLQKSAMNTLKLKLESKAHRFNEFITLTYDDIYVPKAQVIPLKKCVVSDYLPLFLDEDEKFILSQSLDNIGDKYNYALVDVSGRFATDGMLLGSAFMRDIDWFSLRNKVGYGDTINVLRYEDVQLFLKRLRIKIERLYGQKIRYYCCGEYGPKHYRPHWHLVLSYDCPFLAQGIREVIRSCWTYGRVDASKSRGKCSSYVAGYVNSSIRIPEIYKCPQTKPKSYHSIRLGEEFFKVSKEAVYQTKDFGFVNQCVNLDNGVAEFNLWRSFNTRLFPKCKGYSIKSDEERLEAYRLETKVTSVFGQSTKVIDIARKLLGYILRFRYGHFEFTTKQKLFPELLDLIEYFIRSNDLRFSTIVGSHIDKVKLLRSIYIELLCSRYFIRHICNSHDYSVSVEKLQVINEFYSYTNYLSLKRQLQWQQDNLSEYSSFDEYKFIYSNIYFDSDELEDTYQYKVMRESTLKNFVNSIKHKKLNDEYNVRGDN